MTLEIIGAGFGRTGTLSLKAALEQLGFTPCYHMTSLFADTARARRWNDAAHRKARGEPIDWPRLLAGYRATVDWPGAFFWEELVAAYPQAKVLLTVRDPERWYDSARRTIYGLRRLATAPGPASIPFALARRLIPGAAHLYRLSDDVIWNGTFGGRFEDRDHAIRVFNRHVAAVRARVPPDRLLVYDVADGWGPLCALLGVDVPAGIPFPHLNDAAAFNAASAGASPPASPPRRRQ